MSLQKLTNHGLVVRYCMLGYFTFNEIAKLALINRKFNILIDQNKYKEIKDE